jgi:hypothetical protein
MVGSPVVKKRWVESRLSTDNPETKMPRAREDVRRNKFPNGDNHHHASFCRHDAGAANEV